MIWKDQYLASNSKACNSGYEAAVYQTCTAATGPPLVKHMNSGYEAAVGQAHVHNYNILDIT